jgi:hypothetical protein
MDGVHFHLRIEYKYWTEKRRELQGLSVILPFIFVFIFL